MNEENRGEEETKYKSISEAITKCFGSIKDNYTKGLFTDVNSSSYQGELSFKNRYLIILEPGYYQENVILPNFVDFSLILANCGLIA